MAKPFNVDHLKHNYCTKAGCFPRPWSQCSIIGVVEGGLIGVRYRCSFAVAPLCWNNVINDAVSLYLTTGNLNRLCRWSEVVTHVPCGGNAEFPAGRLLITSTLQEIDGVGGTLGSAGPESVWSGCTSISIEGNIRFDMADIADLEADGSFEGVVLHEMGHVIGVG